VSAQSESINRLIGVRRSRGDIRIASLIFGLWVLGLCLSLDSLLSYSFLDELAIGEFSPRQGDVSSELG
jgi:hypothetical protein